MSSFNRTKPPSNRPAFSNPFEYEEPTTYVNTRARQPTFRFDLDSLNLQAVARGALCPLPSTGQEKPPHSPRSPLNTRRRRYFASEAEITEDNGETTVLNQIKSDEVMEPLRPEPPAHIEGMKGTRANPPVSKEAPGQMLGWQPNATALSSDDQNPSITSKSSSSDASSMSSFSRMFHGVPDTRLLDFAKRRKKSREDEHPVATPKTPPKQSLVRTPPIARGAKAPTRPAPPEHTKSTPRLPS